MLNAVTLYARIIGKEVRRFFTYRVNLYSGVLDAVLSLCMRYALWWALFQTGNASGSTFRETMTFFIVTDALFSVLGMHIADTIGVDIRSGDIALRLSKPHSYQLMLIAQNHAAYVSRMLCTGLPMLLIGIFVIGMQLPPSPLALLLFVCSLVLGNLIFVLCDLCISYSAFYLTDSWYISWVTMSLFQLFGGIMLPLWYYPDWLLRITTLLPYRYTVYEPLSIYLGRTPPGAALVVLAQQCAWIGALLLLERLLWRRTRKKLAVQGG